MINYSKISKNIKDTKNSRIAQLMLFVVMLELIFFPFPGFAVNGLENDDLANITFGTPFVEKSDTSELEKLANIEENNSATTTLTRELAWSKRVVMTAYNSEPGQTDDSPCITANGFNVCEHGIEDTVAANFLKFGTEIRIPELFGDRVFVVRDRMNKRYTDRVDVWLLSHDNAIDFGVKYPLIEVLK